jgi:hypothetical protein
MFCWWDDAVLSVDGGHGVTKSAVWGVSGNFYSELGASPYTGRLFTPDDVHINSFALSPVAVIGYRFWQRYFGGDPAVLGKTIRVEGVTFTVVGIMNRGFTGTGIAIEPDIILPLTAAPLLFGEDQKRFGVEAAGRLKNGITLAQARANLESLWPGVQAATLPPDYSSKERDNFLATSHCDRLPGSGVGPIYSRPLHNLTQRIVGHCRGHPVDCVPESGRLDGGPCER